MRRGRYRLMLSLVLCCMAMPAMSASLLRLEQLQGSGEVINGASRDPLVAGLELQVGDQVSLSADSRASLTLGRNGVLELGSGAVLQVEELPFASFADELHTVLRLQAGYLRLIWKQRPWDVDWPLTVILASERASLETGEYYFAAAADESAATAYRYCIAEGQISLGGPESSTAVRRLASGSCYRPHQNSLQVSEPLSAERWAQMRESRQMMAAPDAAVIADVAVTEAAAESPAGVEPPAPAAAGPASPAAVSAIDAALPARLADADTSSVRPTVWAINFASLSDRAYAEQILQRVRSAGFKAQIEQTIVSKRRWYRVQLPGIQTREQAEKLLRRLKAKGFAKAWIVSAA